MASFNTITYIYIYRYGITSFITSCITSFIRSCITSFITRFITSYIISCIPFYSSYEPAPLVDILIHLQLNQVNKWNVKPIML